jgi:hypothetical protein
MIEWQVPKLEGPNEVLIWNGVAWELAEITEHGVDSFKAGGRTYYSRDKNLLWRECP